MRKTVRLVTSTTLGAILLLSIGVGATLAKPATEKPTVEVIDLGDAWCHDDTVDLYCNVVTGTLTITTWPDGSSTSRIDRETRTVVTHDGAYVADYVFTVRERNKSGADGSYSTDSRERTVWTDGVQRCVTTSHFKRVDFDVKIDTYKTNCD